MQVSASDPAARTLGEMVLRALYNNALFLSAAMPLEVLSPMFNRYQGGQSYGGHFDAALMQVPGSQHRLRTDLSATPELRSTVDFSMNHNDLPAFPFPGGAAGAIGRKR